MLKDHIKVIGDDIILTGDELRCYIPDTYFDKKVAEIKGDVVESIGVFPCIVYSKDKPGKVETFNIPTKTTFFPTAISAAEISLIPSSNPTRYKILKFFKGDIICKKYIIPNSINVESYFGMMTNKTVPDTTPYGKIMKIWTGNIGINNVNIGVPSVVLELVASEVYRDENNPSNKFALVIGKNPNHSDTGYSQANMREICGKNSTFAAVTFEDIDSAITTSLNMKLYNKDQKISPMEKVIKY